VSLRDKFYCIDATAVVPTENSELPACDPSPTVGSSAVVVVVPFLTTQSQHIHATLVCVDVTYHDDS